MNHIVVAPRAAAARARRCARARPAPPPATKRILMSLLSSATEGGGGGGEASRPHVEDDKELVAPPEFGSARELEVIAVFRRANFDVLQQYKLHHPHSTPALLRSWVSCCVRSTGYTQPELGASRLQNYLAWRSKNEVEMLGSPLNGGVRDILQSAALRLPGSMYAMRLGLQVCVSDVDFTELTRSLW
jgi:hypothetical protein